MKIARNLSHFRSHRAPLVMAAGFFDGVHRGHVRVIRAAVSEAKQLGAEAWVLTFEPHPQKVLSPGAAPALLTSLEHKLAMLSLTGADGCVVLPFTRALAALSPARFIKKLKAAAPTLRELVVGRTWTFGRGRKGNAAALRRLGERFGFKVKIVPPLLCCGAPVSSTRIRRHILNGDLKKAAMMLGRPFSVTGVVKHGRGLGRRLGFPTANIAACSEVFPPPGVYAALAKVAGKTLPAAANIGFAPTTGARRKRPRLELHVPGVKIQLLGRKVETVFVARLRPEKKFRSLAALKRAIRGDIRKTEAILRRAQKMQGALRHGRKKPPGR